MRDFDKKKQEGLKTIRAQIALDKAIAAAAEDDLIAERDRIREERWRIMGDKAFEHRYVRRPLLTDDDKHEY
ncbi:hypothetical protein MUP59_08255 [Candidatus Bathyarchaeota archaeon]|nr:hypothetical protein [Candidatus Bathyarchaeota archaeon]